MTGVPIKRRNLDTETNTHREEINEKMEAKTG